MPPFPVTRGTPGARTAGPSWPPRHVLLVHNTRAGDASPSRELLLAMLSEAGYQTRYRRSDEAWQEALQPPLDLVVAVGGDGTVAKVVRAVLGRRLLVSVLPVGTANNIAKALGITGDGRSVIRDWQRARPRAFDAWRVAGQGGSSTFVESFGGGFLGRTIASAWAIHPPTLILGGSIDRALFVLRRSIAESPACPWGIELDGRDLSGTYIGVEILNTPTVGPNLPLAPDADPGDGALDLVLVSEADRDELQQRLHEAATAQTPSRLRLPVERGSRISLLPPPGVVLHVDDETGIAGQDGPGGAVTESRIEPAGQVSVLAAPVGVTPL